ncbi:MAG: sulfotransferase domain-containing protein [Salinimicrobium sp.]
MKLLQIGYPKSGNFWLYQILEQILIRSGNFQKKFIQQHPIHELAKTWELNYPTQADIDMIDITELQTVYRISSIFQMPVTNFSEYLQNTNHVWTHSPVCERTAKVYKYFNKKVYVVRDPRDVVLSAAKYYCSPYMLKYFPQPISDPEEFLNQHFERLLQEWVWHVWDHLRLQEKFGLHLSFFEGFKLNFQQELVLLLEYLQLKLPALEKIALEEAVSFKTLKNKNPKHLKKGTSGYWMDRFSEEQAEKAEMIAGPLIRFLGYPERDRKMTFSRSFPHRDFQQLKEELIHSQQPLYS